MPRRDNFPAFPAANVSAAVKRLELVTQVSKMNSKIRVLVK